MPSFKAMQRASRAAVDIAQPAANHPKQNESAPSEASGGGTRHPSASPAAAASGTGSTPVDSCFECEAESAEVETRLVELALTDV